MNNHNIIKGKQGFQAKKQEDKLVKRVSCYLTQKEFDLYQKKLADTNSTSADFIRQLIQLRIMK